MVALGWQMIGEAIDALGEAGGSSEDAISDFIRGAHPGVPAAHDRFLRHYLAKHVAEGLFVCTASGRYARCHDDDDAIEAPVVQVKRGRGRPRKDGSSSASPAGKKVGSSSATSAAEKNGSAGPAAPKRRGRPRRVPPLGSGNGSVPAPSDAAADKNGSQAMDSAPRRCRRLRKLVRSEERATDNEEDAPSTTGKELVVAGYGSTTTETVDDDVCGEGLAADSDQPRELVTTTDMPAPMSPPVDKQDDDEEAESLNLALVVNQGAVSTTSTAPEPSKQACELALVPAEDGPVPVLVAGNTEGDGARSAMYRRLRQPRAASPPVIVAALRCAFDPTAPAANKALPATPSAKDHGRQGELALVATGSYSAPVKVKLKIKPKLYPLTADESHGRQGEPALAATGAHSTPMKIKPKLYPLTADEIPDDPSWCLLALPAAANAC